MIPYDEAQVVAFQTDVEAAYAKAGRQVDLSNVVWAARMVYDATTLGYPASRAKHLGELYAALGLQPPFEGAPRTWRGNMCGVRVPGLPAVPGGAADPTLVLSWFYDRYSDADRARIRAVWTAKDHTHVLLSWPDSRAFDQSPAQFLATCLELRGAGFFPAVMLYSKDYDPASVPLILVNIAPVLALLLHVVPVFCVGWELSIALTPTQVQQLIDTLAPQIVPTGARLYVHFQQGYFAFQLPGQDTAAFWTANVGKLTGVLHQRDLSQDKLLYPARITDCLNRFAGQDNFPTDSGFGHPFDFIALEITAQPQFNGQMTEAEGDDWGCVAINTPPTGAVSVMGSGNGQC